MSAQGLAADLSAGPGEERIFEVPAAGVEVLLGRRPTSDIELPFSSVSADHARMFKGDSAQEWWLEDEGSTNGTWLDGQRLAARRPVPVRPGQRMRVATVDIVFEGWSASSRGDESTGTLARRLIADLFGAAGGEVPSLAVERGPADRANLRLADRDRRYVAGSADTCELVLSGEGVSREHAAFVRRWDGVFVSKLGSKGGVVVNGTPIAGDHRMADGDRIELGAVTLRLADPEDRYLRRIQAAGEGAEPRAASARPPPLVEESPRRSPAASQRSAMTAAETSVPDAAEGARPTAGSHAVRPRPRTGAHRTAARGPTQLRTLALVLVAGIAVASLAGLILLLAG